MNREKITSYSYVIGFLQIYIQNLSTQRVYPITLTEPSQRKSVNKGQLVTSNELKLLLSQDICVNEEQLETSNMLRLLLSHNKISNKGQLEISSELRVL